MKYLLLILAFSFNSFAMVSGGDRITAKKFKESTLSIGTIQQSLLTETEFQSLQGDCWVRMRGQDISSSDLSVKTNGRLNTLPNTSNRFLRDTGSGLGAMQNQDWKTIQVDTPRSNSYDHYISVPKTGSYSGGVFSGRSSGDAYPMKFRWDNNSEIRPMNMGVNFFIKINHECN